MSPFFRAICVKKVRLKMIDFNVIKWAIKQPKEILVGIVIFAASYLTFLKRYNSPISIGEHFLCFLLFLSASLLVGFFVSFLSRGSYRKLKSIKNERLLKNIDAAKIFKQIELEGNMLENNPLFNSGLVGCINISKLALELNIKESQVKNFVQQFKKFNWLKYDIDGNIYGLSDFGRETMFKRNIDNTT